MSLLCLVRYRAETSASNGR